MRCFFDYKNGGSLCRIFLNMYAYKEKKEWATFEKDMMEKEEIDPEMAELLLGMSKEILDNLIDQGYIQRPFIFLSDDIGDELRNQLTDQIEKCAYLGEIVHDMNEATHIIHAKVDASLDDYVRPIFYQGSNVMIHYIYLSASHDSFVENTFDWPVSIRH